MGRALFAGGCFWCLEAIFSNVRGVVTVTSGYAGGDPARADYRSVCSGDSGHAETVEIRFDPAIVSYDVLLEIFFAIHDPCSLNRQGHDIGSQYRSAIFTLDEAQCASALAMIERVQQRHPGQRVVTEVVSAGPFFPAEIEHQQYYRQNRHAPYCQAVIAPKEAAFRQHFKDWLS